MINDTTDEDKKSFDLLIRSAFVSCEHHEPLPNGNKLVVFLSGPRANWFLTAAEMTPRGQFIAKRVDHPFTKSIVQGLPKL